MSRPQLILLITAIVFVLAGATMLYMSPSRQDLEKKVVARSRAAKKQLWKYRS